VLLVDSLLDDYTRSWTAGFAQAFDRFREEVLLAKKAWKVEGRPSEFWLRYGQLTQAAVSNADAILRRHQFFTKKMYDYLQPQLKDPTRIFGALETELIYYRDKKVCQVCAIDGKGHDVSWADHEIHHVEEHSKGGLTTLENGALVHKHCHPKGAKATAEFAEKWKKTRATN